MGFLSMACGKANGMTPPRLAGRFVPTEPLYRNWVTPDGSPGPSGLGGFPAERGRYHLYVSLACPYAHRTVIFRKLKKLDSVISMSILEPVMGEQGWEFGTGPGTIADTINGKQRLGEIYLLADPRYTGRVSVPVLWDIKRCTIVNNESSEIIRMLNSAFAALTDDRADYYPPDLRGEIDRINARVYKDVNVGVYRAGFATTQDAYEEGFRAVFAALDWIEERLSRQRFLAGARLTEADWRLFTTLLRFDAVYYSHFKCNLRRIADYPNLSNYRRDIYQVPGIADTVNMDHIKRHYYMSMTAINPTRIVPLGPEPDFAAPHDRGVLSQIEKRIPRESSSRASARAGVEFAECSGAAWCAGRADDIVAHAVKPHKVRYYLERRDTDFAKKMAEVLCVYRQVKILKKAAAVSKKKPSDAVAIVLRREAGYSGIATTAPIAACARLHEPLHAGTNISATR